MKRTSELRNLSSDHHRALVIAKRAKKAKPDSAFCETWLEIEQYYSRELENHLRAEEAHIVPGLEKLGKYDLVNQLNKEHKEIRNHFQPKSSRSFNALIRFGKLLEQHVRFEDRELFNVVQESFTQDMLASIKDACIK